MLRGPPGLAKACGCALARPARQAITALEEDHDFLLEGEVFNPDQIAAYAELRWSEVYTFEQAPHPVEFQMYYSA